MNWIKLIVRLGILPVTETASGEVNSHLFSIKYMMLAMLKLALCSFNFYGVWIYYDFQSIGIIEIIKIMFYWLAVDSSMMFQVVLGRAAKKIGPLALDIKYKVFTRFFGF